VNDGNNMTVLYSGCNASKEEDAAAETSTSRAELGRDEVKPGQGNCLLGA